jgi:hypothetical protein
LCTALCIAASAASAAATLEDALALREAPSPNTVIPRPSPLSLLLFVVTDGLAREKQPGDRVLWTKFLSAVMPGLVPGIHVFAIASKKVVDGRHRRAEATPFFERLCPAMTH